MGKTSRRLLMASRDPDAELPSEPKAAPTRRRIIAVRPVYRVLARKAAGAKRSASIMETRNLKAAMDFMKSLKSAGTKSQLKKNVKTFEEVGTTSKRVRVLSLPKREKKTKAKTR